MDILVSDLSFKVSEGGNERIILDSINYKFEHSKITTISGPSGSGKTTLLYALAGLLDIFEGDVEIMNKRIYTLSSIQRDKFRLENIGVIFQNLNLMPFMNVQDNILLPFYLRGTKITKEIFNKLNEYLEILGLGEIREKPINTLSGGEQQRIAIIRSMLSEPNIILCDEPTGSLDSKNAIKFMDSIVKLNKINKTTIIIVTHDELVNNYGEAKVKMHDGKIIMN